MVFEKPIVTSHLSVITVIVHYRYVYVSVSVSEKIIVGPHGVPDPPSLAQMPQ